MMRRLLVTVCMVLMPALLLAQLQNDRNRTGSAYSSIGVGEPVDLYTPNAAGGGLTGVSMYDQYSVNSANPALWGVGLYTQGAISFDMQRLQADDGQVSSTYNRIKTERFQIVLPIVRSRFGISAGFLPVTRSDFSIMQESSTMAGDQPLDFINSVEGSGGVNRAELGFGLRITDQLSVGYAASLYFATLNREHGFFFDDSDFLPVQFREEMTGNRLGHRFGLYARTGSLLRSGDELAFGGSLTLPATITMDREVSAFRAIDGRQQRVDLLPASGIRSGEVELPLDVQLGLTYELSRFVTLSTEYMQQQWGESGFSFRPSQEQNLANRSRIAIGSVFHPYRRDGAEGLFSSLKYSAGVSYDTGHLDFQGQRLETLMLHSGVGILSSRTYSSVDLGFKVGFRGGGDTDLIDETVWGLKLTLNLAELMFVPPRFQ